MSQKEVLRHLRALVERLNGLLKIYLYRYCTGNFIKDSIIRVLLNITGKSYFLRPKPAFLSAGILSVIKVLKLKSPVIKILTLRSPVLKKF